MLFCLFCVALRVADGDDDGDEKFKVRCAGSRMELVRHLCEKGPWSKVGLSVRVSRQPLTEFINVGLCSILHTHQASLYEASVS